MSMPITVSNGEDEPLRYGHCPHHGRVAIDHGEDAHIADDGPDTAMGHAPGCMGSCYYCPVPIQIDPRYICGPVTPEEEA